MPVVHWPVLPRDSIMRRMNDADRRFYRNVFCSRFKSRACKDQDVTQAEPRQSMMARNTVGRSVMGAAALLALLGAAACQKTADTAPPVMAVAQPVEDAKPAATRTPSNKSIPITVNDVPITQYDIQQRTRLMRLGGGKGSTQAAADELINETIQAQEAQRRGISVPQSQIESAYGQIAGNLKLSTSQLTQALRGEGIDADALKKRLRAQMLWSSLVQQRTQTQASVRTEDITAALLQKGDPNAMTVSEFMLQQIVFVVPSGSSSGVYAQRRREAEAFRQRYRGCDSALEQAKALRGVVVKNIGRRDSSQLQGQQGEQIQKTPAGKTASPVQIAEGIEVIGVCSVKQVQSSSAARAQVENDLYLKQAEGLGKEFMAELRKRAIIQYR